MRESNARSKLFVMTETLQELAAALRERLTIVADKESRRNADAHMLRLQRISERIEGIERQLPPTIDPQLRHYLQRRSYTKALELLQGNATS